jgi:hypothetical protein
MLDTKPKCECPDQTAIPFSILLYEPEEYKAMSHKPYECPGDYLMAEYERDGQKIILCSCCHMSGDIKIKDL